MEEFSCPSECEEAEGKDGKCSTGREKSSGVTTLSVVWAGSAGKIPLILFRANAILGLDSPNDHPISGTHRLTFKISGDFKLVRTLLLSHGLSEVSWLNAQFNIYWSGSNIQMSEVRGLMPHQRFNHFPRSYMITRKDKLCQNISRMQQSMGTRNFNIIPTTFVLPEELGQFQVHFRKNRGVWIMKPVSSSRGRGITIINHPNQVNKDEPMVVAQYIHNPLCVNGFKFDLRIYVAVTSFNPLKIYMYEEGLARFATEQYSGPVQLTNLCMHLTNYSVNKRSSHYVRCDSPGRDDYGSKWSMSALLRHLLKQGINVAELMMKVEDVIIKALIAGESHISSACDVFQTHKGNCFELYGFDILIDETLTPWLLEVNLSPSLGCDAPLDIRLKSNLIADLLTLVGVPLCNPNTRESPKPPKSQHHHHHRRPPATKPMTSSRCRLTSSEMKMVRDCREEYERRRGFVRIFPNHDSWNLYSSFLESKGRLNLVLHQELYPDRVMTPQSPSTLSSIIAKRANVSLVEPPSVCDFPDGLVPLERVAVYLRRLENGAKIKPMWDSVCELLWRQRETSSMPTSLTDTTTKISKQLQNLNSDITKLSKVQARRLFAAYLACVQQRLSQEARDIKRKKGEATDDRANFDMVVRFLKRAAQNLSSPFVLVEPNTELPMKDRKGMLGRQLEGFITLYNQETVDLAANPTEALGLSSEVLDVVFSNSSEKELEKLLAAYAQRSHSSTVLFGSAATHTVIIQRPTTTQSTITSQRLTRGQPHAPPSTQVDSSTSIATHHRLAKSSKHLLSWNAISRVLQRQSRLPRTLSSSSINQAHLQGAPYHQYYSAGDRKSSENQRKSPESEADCTDIINSPPPYNFTNYSEDMIDKSSLPLSQKRSLHVLTQSLTTGSSSRGIERGSMGRGRGTDRLPPRGPGGKGRNVRTKGREVRGDKSVRLLRRTLSSQSLLSVSSDASEQSMKSVQSVGIEPWSSIDKQRTIRVNSRPRSASVVSDKMKNYVSPYAQQSLRKRPHVPERKSTSFPMDKLREPSHPQSHNTRDQSYKKASSITDEDSTVTEALHRLALKQLTRHYTAGATTVTNTKTKPYQSRLAWTRPRNAKTTTSDSSTEPNESPSDHNSISLIS